MLPPVSIFTEVQLSWPGIESSLQSKWLKKGIGGSVMIVSRHLKQLLFQFGFGYAWLANEVGDTIAFTKLFKIRVVVQYKT